MVMTDRCVFYYGEQLPNPHAAGALDDCAVVLQPYHPLVRAGRYAEFFPRCRRFVYWNPTGVHGGTLPLLDQRVRLEQWDPEWKIARLDLTDEPTQDYAVGTGINALSDGADGHGLFVDDLDLWSKGRRQTVARRVLARVAAAAGGEFRWFINRAFPLWKSLPLLHAVALEELTSQDVAGFSEAQTAWVKRVVLPPVRQASRAGVRVFGISYAAPAAASSTGSVVDELSSYIDATVRATRNLDEWPEDLR